MQRLFRWLVKLRNVFSKTIAPVYFESGFEPPVPQTLPELAGFMSKYYKWKRDPAYGLLDHIKPIRAMNFDLEHDDKVVGDCDDLSTYTAWMLLRMEYTKVYRVNIPSVRHVICVFERSDFTYQVCDNSRMWLAVHPSLDVAVRLWASIHKHKTLSSKGYVTELLSIDDFN